MQRKQLSFNFKTEITTFNNLSPPRHPSAILEYPLNVNSIYCSVSAALNENFVLKQSFDLNEYSIYCLRSVDTIQNGARVTRRRRKVVILGFLCIQKVFSYLCKIRVEHLMSHGLFYQSPCYVSGR